MASKENQRCIDQIKSIISHPIPDMAMAREFIIDYLNKLQQAIDRLEITEKALYNACSIINKQFDGCYHCENKKCTAEINKVDDCGIEKLEEYLLKESEKENGK